MESMSVFLITEQGNSNIWIYHVTGGAINQLTFYKEQRIGGFAWSPDSKTLAYVTSPNASPDSFYIKRIDGNRAARKIFTSPSVEWITVYDWYKDEDGDHLLLNRRINNWDVFVYSFQDSTLKPFITTPAYDGGPNISPNGNWVSYTSGESGTNEIYVRPYTEDKGGVWKISNGGGGQPVWAPDGKKIYYRRGNEMFSVDVTATDTFSKGNPKKIFEGNYFLPFGRRWDIHPNGDRFIMIQIPEETSPDQKIFVIRNFSEELKRLVPVNKD